MTAPLCVWRVPFELAGEWFSPKPWRWKCWFCSTSSNDWYGNGAASHASALEAALGHLAVWHTDGTPEPEPATAPVERMMEP